MTMAITIRNEGGEVVGSGHEWEAELRVTLDEDHKEAIIEVVDRHSSDNGTPISIWNGRDLRWSHASSQGAAGVVDASRLAVLAEQLRPLLETVAAGHDVEWDGRNMSGKLTDAASEASDKIDDIVAAFEWADDEVAVWDATEWVAANWQEVAKDLLLTTDATDEDKAKAARELDSWAKSDRVILTDTDDAVDYLIEKLTDAA